MKNLFKKFCDLFIRSPSLPHLTVQQLKLCELNLENLFISLEHHNGGDFTNYSESEWRRLALPQLRDKQKPINKLWGLTAAITDINPDVLMLVEVGGKESLDHFNHHFLKDAYVPHFVETNSRRAIDLAFMVKKDLNLKAKAISNRHLPVKVSSSQNQGLATRFSRDVAEFHLSRGRELRLILLLVHLKSKISTDRDFQGRDMRRAEAEALAALYQQIAKNNPHIPIIVGGDFNSDLTSPELEVLASTDLSDFHDLLGTPREERISLVHFDYHGKAQPQVLDYLLVSPHLKSKMVRESSYTYRYKSFYDTPHPLPTTVHHRYHMPSDHYPVVLTIEF